MLTHLLFDLLAYASALVLTLAFKRIGAGRFPSPVPADLNFVYYFVLTNGVILGSLLFGSLNIMMTGQGLALGKSILGAIVGGIVAIELFKSLRGVKGSTGAVLVPAIALGIFIGRWGCFFAGLDDFTHGKPATGWTGYDFGDGIARHPVQLYEGLTMLVFFFVAGAALLRGSERWWRRGFYYFAVFYGAQRFVWEFFKPYPELVAGLNLFHMLCLALIGYGVTMLIRSPGREHAGHVT